MPCQSHMVVWWSRAWRLVLSSQVQSLSSLPFWLKQCLKTNSATSFWEMVFCSALHFLTNPETHLVSVSSVCPAVLPHGYFTPEWSWMYQLPSLCANPVMLLLNWLWLITASVESLDLVRHWGTCSYQHNTPKWSLLAIIHFNLTSWDFAAMELVIYCQRVKKRKSEVRSTQDTVMWVGSFCPSLSQQKETLQRDSVSIYASGSSVVGHYVARTLSPSSPVCDILYGLT